MDQDKDLDRFQTSVLILNFHHLLFIILDIHQIIDLLFKNKILFCYYLLLFIILFKKKKLIVEYFYINLSDQKVI